jgi:imidazole glycerol-phosphate synthase subunit HisH
VIAIIDYGMGNLESIKNMIKKAGGQAKITSNLDEIANASSLLLPGVGHFSKAMDLINSGGLRQVLDKAVLEEGKPILGICLGMQLLLDHSEEGDVAGLGYISGRVRKFQFDDANMKVPHMGWNEVKIMQENTFIQETDGETQRYYFVHSYFAQCEHESNVLCRTNYGFDFDSGIIKGQIMGVQFHPEKSHKYGLRFFTQYLKQYGH